jgi:transposase
MTYSLDLRQRAVKRVKSQGKRKKKCAEVWYVTVKIIDS